jgi:hypothetical protein
MQPSMQLGLMVFYFLHKTIRDTLSASWHTNLYLGKEKSIQELASKNSVCPIVC